MANKSPQGIPEDFSASEWLRIPGVIAYTGFTKGYVKNLVANRIIKSFLLKKHPSAIRGIRLISRTSIDEYLKRKAKEAGVI